MTRWAKFKYRFHKIMRTVIYIRLFNGDFNKDKGVVIKLDFGMLTIKDGRIVLKEKAEKQLREEFEENKEEMTKILGGSIDVDKAIEMKLRAIEK